MVLLVSAVVVTAFSIEGDSDYAFSDNSLFLEGQKRESVSEGYLFVNGETLLAQSSPSLARGIQVLGADSGREERDRIISHTVEEGETLESIADKFEISKDTIKWANSLSNGSVKAGDDLLILPTSGILYYVERGDTLSHIAQRHKADEEEIINFNEVEDEAGIRPGDQLIIPDGEKPAEPVRRPAPQVTHTGFGAVTYGTVTQGAHPGHSNAVDVANNCGTPIYAGGSGTVTRTGSDPARAGNYIWVDHGSFKALYAHLQSIHVSPGQRVSGGQQIGTMGNTGYTLGATGCHIHFETRGGRNPFSHMQRGQTMR